MTNKNNTVAVIKFILCSLLGVVAFFVPIEVGGKSVVLLDHITKYIQSFPYIYYWPLFIAALSVVLLSRQKTKSAVTYFGMAVGALAFLLFTMAIWKWEWVPAFLMEKDMLPFLFNKLVVPISIILPIGAVFLIFLLYYGLMEFVSVFARPFMMPIWKTSGRSAIDAVTSFVGSYSLALIITDRNYKEGFYSPKEAAIIATGFSTVSLPFMLIVSSTLKLSEHWGLYFFTTFFVTFLVTAISARIPPISRMSGVAKKPETDVPSGTSSWQHAVSSGVKASSESKPLYVNLFEMLKDSVIILTKILPFVVVLGTIGLLLTKFTPVFTWIGYLLWPFLQLTFLEIPPEIPAAIASGFAEMFLPAIITGALDAPLSMRLIVGVCSISSIIFLSATIPCVLSTSIPLNIMHLTAIWFIRTALSIVFTGWLIHLYSLLNWL